MIAPSNPQNHDRPFKKIKQRSPHQNPKNHDRLSPKKRQFKDEMQRYLMKQRVLRKECDSQEIFSVCG
ncbi:MAG: hypothetical protein ACKPCM_00770 [Pseudanabaena sp.]